VVDFEKLAEDNYRRATPEQRARIDAYHEREAKFDQTKREIEATFTQFSERPISAPTRNGPKTETYASKTWDKTIEVRIEDTIGHEGLEYEIIKFIGGATGYEAYRLDEEFAMGLIGGKWADSDTMWICAGSARYNRCAVATSDIIEYIREVRPELLGIGVRTAPPQRAKISF
jgi:hypothetical protein